MDWLPLIVAAVIGIIIGAIFTVIPYRRRGEEFQYRIRDLESKLKKTDTYLNDARSQGQSLTANLRTTETNLTDAKGQVALLTDAKNTLDTSVASLTEEKNTLTANLGEATTKIASLGDEKAALEVALAGMTAQSASMRKEYDAKITTLNADLEGQGAELATLKTNAEATAQTLTAKEAELAEAQTSLEGIKQEMDTLTNLKIDLESKLARARADVAAELALLTSTMIKMKEQALGEANAKITTLTGELNALKGDHGSSN
jgi:chromosome segregation ATPase